MGLAFTFLALYSTILTISPAVRYHTWQANLRWIHWLGFSAISTAFFFLQQLLRKQDRICDPFILPIIYLLSGWGFLTISRLSTFFGVRQALWILGSVGLTYVLLKSRKPIYRWLNRYSKVGLMVGLCLLAATLIWGSYPGGEGPRLWLRVFSINLQPSEFLKLFFIIYLSSRLSKSDGKSTIKTILPTLVVFLSIIVILVAQNDFGTLLLFVIIYAAYILFYTDKKRIFAIIVLSFLALAYIGYQYFDIFSTRITSWLSPWEDPGGSSYQVIQSIIAIASGGLLGTGPGLGYPNIVPLVHSDFIFSAIAEETGFIGTSAFILLLALLLVRGYKLARKAPNSFQHYVAAGVTTSIIAQAIIIIGGNIRLLPITGITLPFVSYGGSSFVSAFLGISLLFCMDSTETVDLKKNNQETSLRQALQTLGTLFLVALLAIEIVMLRWSYIRADDLQKRSDNARLIYADLYVPRGKIYDRNSIPLAISTGDTGSLYRQYLYAPLSNTLGFSHVRYGRAGLEESYNQILRGYEGSPSTTIWLTHLMYDQPPEGLDIQLSLDLLLQQELDELLTDYTGASLVMDIETGDILAISSSPWFDANKLNENWAAWAQDENAPFLNRALQGSYPADGVLLPFLVQDEGIGISEQIQENIQSLCTPSSTTSEETLSLKRKYFNNIDEFLSSIALEELTEQLASYDFFSNAAIGLPLSEIYIPQNNINASDEVSVDDQIRVSPLLIAQAAGKISNAGDPVIPRLILSPDVEIDDQEGTLSEIDPDAIRVLLDEVLCSDHTSWFYSAISEDENAIYYWAIRGSLPLSGSKRTVVVTVLENADLASADQISNAIYELTQSLNY